LICPKRPDVMHKMVNKNTSDMFTGHQCWFWRKRKLENLKGSREFG
jgi:hypothetical protein